VILSRAVAVPAPPDTVFGLLNDWSGRGAFCFLQGWLLGQRLLLKELSRER
jgi:hypothetical protein